MKSSVILCAVFAGGVFVGYVDVLPEFMTAAGGPSLWALYVLLFLVGIGIGGSGKAWRVLKRLHARAILVPLSVVAGTFLGVGLVGLVLPGLRLSESLAVGAGFGYYSLSSVIIREQFGNETLGAVALTSNLLREIVTLIMVPLLVRWFGKLVPIGVGGATTMDSTLPVITKFTGKEYAMIAVFSGVVLTLLVPILVPLLLSL